MEVSQETIVITSDIPDSSDIPDTPLELFWDAHWTLAKAYYHQQNYDGALKESQDALNGSHGSAPDIELLLAQSLTAVGRYDEAAQALRAFLKNHAKDPSADKARRWLDRLTADGKIKQ